MEHCLRIAIWILVIGVLQGRPVSPALMSDLGFGFLQQIECGKDMTFCTPTNVKDNCFPAALEVIVTGLEEAMEKCSGDTKRIGETLEVIEEALQLPAHENPKGCQWTGSQFQKPFGDFVNNTKTLFEFFATNLQQRVQ